MKLSTLLCARTLLLGTCMFLPMACGGLEDETGWDDFAELEDGLVEDSPSAIAGDDFVVQSPDFDEVEAEEQVWGDAQLNSASYRIDFTKGKVVAKGQHFEIAGKRLKLAGNHTWDTVVKFGGKSTPLTALVGNFTRLWPVEVSRLTTNGASDWTTNKEFAITPLPWKRTNGKFDLDKLNTLYFDRLEAKVKQAEEMGMVVSVVLFDGAYNRFFGTEEWTKHPLNPNNNLQGVGPSHVNGIHASGDHVPYQRKYVKEVIRRVGGYPNVLFEIGNELHSSSVAWQKSMVRLVKKRSDRPVGVSYVTSLRDNAWMKTSGADWFAPHFSSPTRPA
ncbi:MAG: hypothetical protein ACO3JL_21045, partial [Myxococcota bacterium]